MAILDLSDILVQAAQQQQEAAFLDGLHPAGLGRQAPILAAQRRRDEDVVMGMRRARHGVAGRSASVASAQGRRPSMEDAFGQHWVTPPGAVAGPQVVALFDGHHGGAVAMTASRIVPSLVALHLETLDPAARAQPERVAAKLMAAFAAERGAPLGAGRRSRTAALLPTVDEALAAALAGRSYAGGGATALVAVLWADQLYVANLGDSRAILVHDDGRGQRLSQDQTLSVADERESLRRRAGAAALRLRPGLQPRVMGGLPGRAYGLAVTRALGDWHHPILRRPRVSWIDRRQAPTATALMLGCDGIFDVMDDQVVACEVAAGGEAEDLVRGAYLRGGGDNLTAWVLPLSPPA